MRTLRLLAGLWAAAALGTAGPAFAGGGAGMTVTASVPGRHGPLPYGSPQAVWVEVTDSPLGEATLEHITVTVAGAATPVVCDRGPNGTVVLVPGGTVDCSTWITVAAGSQTVIAQATGVVAGGGDKLVRTVVVTYQGTVPTPKPAPSPSSPRAVVVRPPALPTLPTFSRSAPPTLAPSVGCASSATSSINGGACVPAAMPSMPSMPSMACLPTPSPAAGPGPAGASGCVPELPTASPAAGCAGGNWSATPGSGECATASGRGKLALTGAQILLWGAVAVTAIAAGVVLLTRRRRIVR